MLNNAMWAFQQILTLAQAVIIVALSAPFFVAGFIFAMASQAFLQGCKLFPAYVDALCTPSKKR